MEIMNTKDGHVEIDYDITIELNTGDSFVIGDSYSGTLKGFRSAMRQFKLDNLKVYS